MNKIAANFGSAFTGHSKGYMLCIILFEVTVLMALMLSL